MELSGTGMSGIRLRSATATDCKLLFEWVNRPDSLAGKLITAGPISFRDHEAWFIKKLEPASSTFIWIIEQGGWPCGQIRFDGTARSGIFEIDIYLEPKARGGGRAGRALCLAMREFFLNHQGARLRANVRHENTASLNLFRRAGFKEVNDEARFLTLEKVDHV